MKAKFKTKCSECDGTISVGEEISKTSDGRWVHKHCAPEPSELP